MRRTVTAFLMTLLGVGLLGAPSARAADFWFTRCEAEVTLHQVVIRARVCNTGPETPTIPLHFYIEPGTATAPSGTPEFSQNVLLGAGACQDIVIGTDPFNLIVLPNGKYHLFCEAEYAADTLPGDNLSGPKKFVVGPDLWIYSFWITKEGDTTNYFAIVCNTGTDTARNFRVGFYYDRSSPPADGDFSDAFKSLTELQPAYYWWHDQFAPWLCEKIELKRTPTPNDQYRSYVKVDEGMFVEEADEDNNWAGPLNFTMSNPDLVIEKFDARVSAAPPYSMYWDIRVCNRGTATAGPFWADIYWDRSAEDPPQLGQPGDDNYGWRSLPPEACVDHTFERHDVDETSAAHPEYETWLQVDADEFVYDPDRSTNLEGPLDVLVPGGVKASGCVDNDGDGFGVGSECPTQEDCNDANPSIHPGAQETCEDGIDQNCNGTPDDGCPGVDCADQDGDGWPSGSSCVIADCDDANPLRFPGNPEICGDGLDQDCDGIPDDCCPGSSCCDMDNDGYGVGPGCPGGEQDCDDTNPAAGSVNSPEICGDNQDNDCDGLIDENCPGSYCVDEDGDGYGVGEGCTGIQDPDDSDPNIPSAEEVCGDGIDNDANGVIDDGCPGCTDYDGDGYGVGDDCAPGERDCDESDPDVHPGAPEVCDLVDNNCNFTIDEGTPGNLCPDPQCVIGCAGDAACIANCDTLNCVDNDGDGWGSGSACQVEDCDDSDPNVHPNATEVCDLEDNDCDGTPDDGTPGNPCPNVQCVIGCAGDQTCINACPDQDCIDHDGDGWGVGEDCVESDPNDEDPATWPGAPEICGDGIDQSGDGILDEGCVLCTDHDGDGYGVGPFCDVRDCNDDDPTVFPGASETCGNKDLNCDAIPPAKTECESCSCSHDGGSPLSHWPTATLILLVLGALLRRRRS